jgi:hypothetical protein
MLIFSIDGTGMINIHPVNSRLKLACEAEQAGDIAKANMLFANALQAELPLAELEKQSYLKQINL